MEELRAADQEAQRELQTVVFRLGDEYYGIDIFRVNEIIRMRDITPVPRTEPHILGLVNLRGKTIPVVDIRVRMNLPDTAQAESTRIIVVDSSHGNVGIVVDAVTEVVSLDRSTIDDAPTLAQDSRTEFILGVAKREGELIMLLDLDETLAA
ncbi:MAG: purine-binding chemotaxis protein CheW [Armatimonadetes bacterium]|nr:purine-binding chemotaxis protein CheW [Armatimonadota bacterium]